MDSKSLTGCSTHPAAVLPVEQRGEDRRGVEARDGQPVDGAGAVDQRDRATVAQRRVVLDGGIARPGRGHTLCRPAAEMTASRNCGVSCSAVGRAAGSLEVMASRMARPVVGKVRRNRRLVLEAREGRLDRVARVGHRAREALQQDEPERVDVARRGGRLPHRLLGAEVGGRPGRLALVGLRRCARDAAGDAEVGQSCPGAERGGAVRDEHDVRRLDVAVDDAVGVHVLERLGDVVRDLGDLLERQLPLAQDGRPGRCRRRAP